MLASPPGHVKTKTMTAPSASPSHRLLRRWPAGAAWLALALGLVLLAAVLGPAGTAARTPPAPREVAPRGPLLADEQATIDLFRRTSPSVVHITTLAAQRDFFTLNVQQIGRAHV